MQISDEFCIMACVPTISYDSNSLKAAFSEVVKGRLKIFKVAFLKIDKNIVAAIKELIKDSFMKNPKVSFLSCTLTTTAYNELLGIQDDQSNEIQ